jgi:hypothetical protein
VSARFDILVPMKNTLLADTGGQLTINGTHNSILASPRVAKLVARFYKSSNGRSCEERSASPALKCLRQTDT